MILKTPQGMFEVGQEAAQWGAERGSEVREGGADTVRETVEDGLEVVAEHPPSFLRP